ncbi:EXS_family protein [Hexamita inflata]|uniref:EXS family protein n=1 Tax=Hexamita inflata TaxID=28002 RepID=A0AA86N4K9_9EUKA|nr:EXS family protein [Hexamita inflata]
MNYGDILKNSIIPEWQNKYIRYDWLKDIVHQMGIVHQLLKQDNTAEHKYMLKIQAEDIDTYFWQEVKMDVEKIHNFFISELSKLLKLILEIETQCDVLENPKHKEQQAIRDNMHEVYKTLNILGNYAQRNYFGLQNLAKSRDKYMNANDSTTILLELVQDKKFALDDPIEHEQQRIEKAFAKLFKVDQKAAKVQIEQYVSPQNNAEKQRVQAATGNGFTCGVAILLFANFIYVMGYSLIEYGNNVIIEKHMLALKAMRILFCLTYLAICIGLDIFVFEKKKLNFIFIFELPPAKITASYRTHLKICFIFLGILSVCCTCAVLRFYLDEHLVNELPNVSYSIIFVGLASIMPGWAWISLPLIFPFLAIVRIAFRWRSTHAMVGKYVLQVIGKQFLPWKYRVAFPIFCFGDQLTSMTLLFSDFADLITNGKAPTIMTFLFLNIPAIIRIIQCIVRYNEKKLAYPHIVNLCKYLSSFPATFLTFNWVKQSAGWTNFMIAGRCVETLYKLYWDYAEDWALFTGGTGVKQFKNQRQKWQHKIVCRRPSFFATYVLLFAVLFNFVGRCFWIPTTYLPMFAAKQFWWKTYGVCVEITRRCLWNVLRTDNQQATNCEDYALTRYIPVLLSQGERQLLKQKIDDKEKELQRDKLESKQQLQRRNSNVPQIASADEVVVHESQHNEALLNSPLQ